MNRKMNRKVRKSLTGLLSLIGIVGLFIAGCDITSPDTLTVRQGVGDAPGTVSGQVIRGDTQKPQDGLTVQVASLPVRTTTTDVNGRFSVSGLAATRAFTGTSMVIISSPHTLSIKDERTVGTGSNQIASESERLATISLEVNITLPPDASGANQPVLNEMGIIGMNVGMSLNVLVTIPGGTVAPDGVTVAAIPSTTECTTVTPIQTQLLTSGAVPVSATTGAGAAGTGNATGTGVASLSGLDKCIGYTIVVPAQVVGGTQMAVGLYPSGTISGVEGEMDIAVALSNRTFTESLSVITSNMTPDSAYSAIDSGTVTFDDFFNVSNAGINSGLTNPVMHFTAPLTGNIIIVFNLPTVLDNDVALSFLNNLIDPDPAPDDGTDDGFGDSTALGGTVSGSLDTATSSILTITHSTALVANQIYTMQGTVRNIGTDSLSTLNTLSSSGSLTSGTGTVYATDSSQSPSSSNITADNLNGLATSTTASQVFLQFTEAVAGTGRVISVTTNGDNDSVQGSNFTIFPDNGSVVVTGIEDLRLASFFGDGAPVCSVFGAVNTVTGCRGSSTASDGVTFAFPIPSVSLADNQGGTTTTNTVEIFLDVVDTQGNRFTGILSLNIN